MQVYDPLCGTHIERAINKVIDMVNRSKSKKAIMLSFNGTKIKVSHKKHPKALAKFYDNECKRHSAEYRNSPEGKQADHEAEERKLRLQNEADKALSELNSLDFSNLKAVIGWFEQIQDASDHVGVDVKPTHIVNEFLQRGFKPGVNCGKDFNGDDEENFARYIIGQALDNLIHVGAIHHMIGKFAEDWRTKFGCAA